MLRLGLSGLSLGQRGGGGEPPIITATVDPVLAALTDAQTPADGFTSGTYVSTAGTISSEVAAYLVNGSPELGTYDMAAGDTVRVSETVTDSAANERVFWTATIVVQPSVALSNTAVPVISGTFEVGQTVSSTQGTWAGSASRTYAYQWLRGGVAISGAISSTYTLVAADEGANVSCEVTADDGFTQVSAESTAEAVTWPAPVAAGGLADQSYDEDDGVKTVDAAVDFTGAVAGTWSVNSATGISISAAGVVSIDTATASSGTVIVTYTNSGGSDSSAFSLTVGDAATHVFLLIGQSNMVGWDTFDEGTGFPSNVYQYDQDGEIVAATVPLDHNDANSSYMSLGLQFAIDYAAANPSATILLVPRAETGTSLFTSWAWGSALREGAIQAANDAMAAATAPVFKGILWHQGESDAATDNMSAAYAKNLRRLIEDLRDRITGAGETTPFVCGEMLQGLSTAVRPQAYQDRINAALLGVQEDNAYTYGVSSTGLTDKGDSIHFDAASLRTLGSRYYTGLVAAQSAGPLAPEQPDTGDWTISAIGASGEAWLEVLSLPYCRGGKLTAIEYQIDGGAWVSLGHPYEGIYPIRGLTDDVAQSISIRGVSDAGNGTASATKSVTPYDDGFGNDFVFTVETTADAETFTVPTWSAFAYNCTIDWGDGASSTVTAYNDAALAHEYATAGQYQVRISGTFEAFTNTSGGAKAKIVSVEQLGATGWKSIASMFSGATKLVTFRVGVNGVSAISGPSLTKTMFGNCTNLVFADMAGTDLSACRDLSYTFSGCSSLVAADMTGISIPAVTTLAYAFKDCTSLRSVKGLIVPSTCTTLLEAFRATGVLEYLDTTGWNTSGVTTMRYAFYGTGLESLDVSGWNTSSLTSLEQAFAFAIDLRDLAIDGWNVASLTNGATAFFNVFLPTSRYDAALIAWGAQTVQSGVSIDFGYTKYTAGGAAEAGRANLVSAGWTIADEGTV